MGGHQPSDPERCNDNRSLTNEELMRIVVSSLEKT